MSDLYAEAGVKRKDTFETYVLRFLLIFGAIVAFLLTLQNSILLFVTAILIMVIVYIFPRLSVEYEYVFCDGQLDFDKIMGNAKRKTVMKLDFEQIEMMAPQGSHTLDGFTNVKCTVKDFSSKRKDVKPYIIIARKGEMRLKIFFEPNENMISCMKTKFPRKISEY